MKNPIFSKREGGGVTKNQYNKGDCLKGGVGKYSLQIYEGGRKKERDGVFGGGKGWVDISNAYNVQSSNKMQWCSLEYLARTAKYLSSRASIWKTLGLWRSTVS